ncbi:MAG: hypothetical protein ABSB59_14710 [Streptosporangiaceae bacterium]
MIATNERFESFIDDDDDGLSEIELRVLDLEKDISEFREARTRQVRGPARRRPDFTEPDIGLTWEADEPEPEWEWDDDRESGWGPSDHSRTQALIDHGRRTARPRTIRRQSVRQDTPRQQAERREPGRQQAGRREPAGPDPIRRAAVRQKTSRSGAARRGRSRHGRKVVIGSVAGLAVIGIGALIVLRPGPSWPASVATIRSEITTACQNPNVAAEPSQVNFACGKDTSQILWVFSLLTSGDDPGYADAETGRKGLEPIAPTQGGEIAWSLNLHHPYNPLSAVDSLEVAARAINNIIGGATLTSANGTPTVQPGLEAKPGNCARYTGSPAIVSHAGFPSLCASPVTSQEGQAALVADVYQQWMPGAGAVAAQNASVLFQNAGNPGDPQVQAILKTLPHGK